MVFKPGKQPYLHMSKDEMDRLLVEIDKFAEAISFLWQDEFLDGDDVDLVSIEVMAKLNEINAND